MLGLVLHCFQNNFCLLSAHLSKLRITDWKNFNSFNTQNQKCCDSELRERTFFVLQFCPRFCQLNRRSFFPILEGQQGKVTEILCTKKSLVGSHSQFHFYVAQVSRSRVDLKAPLKMAGKYYSKVFSASNFLGKSF